MLSVEEIKQLINEDAANPKKAKAKEGERYYNAEHDILDSRLFYYDVQGELQEDKIRSNIKISHPFFKILIDELSPYMLSFEQHPIRAKETATGLQEYLDEYFDEDFWSEIGDLIDGTGIKGFEYLHAYKNEDNRLVFECADSMGVIEIEGRFASDKKDHVLYWYVDRIDKEGRKIKRIMDWDSQQVAYYIQTDEGEIEKDKDEKINPKPHVSYQENEDEAIIYEGHGFIPFWRLDNNKKQTSSLKPVKALIDDYDLHSCSLSNNLKDFDIPLYVIKGFEGDNLDELSQNLRTKKMIGVDENGGVDVKTVDIPYQARKEKLDLDEKNIYIFGMGFNPAQVGDGNITNIVIKSRYTLLDLRAEKFEKRLKKLLKKIVEVVIDEINAEHGTGYQYSDVKIERFEKNTPSNDSENIANAKTEAETEQIRINTILNVAMTIGDEEALRLICEVLDLDFDALKTQVEKLKEEQNLIEAKNTLEGVVVDE